MTVEGIRAHAFRHHPVAFRPRTHQDFVRQANGANSANVAFVSRVLHYWISTRRQIVLGGVTITVRQDPIRRRDERYQVALRSFAQELVHFNTRWRRTVGTFLRRHFRVTVRPLFVTFNVTGSRAVATFRTTTFGTARRF